MFIIEGNIGAGKSTFLQTIQKKMPALDVVFEPVHQWHKQGTGHSLLAEFYKDPQRWAYTLETFAMVCRVQEHLKEQENPNLMRIMERSIFSGHYCFAKNDYVNGYMTELEWQVYQQWFDFLLNKKCKLPQGFIYLRTEPTVAHARIAKRARTGEDAISLDYITQIHERHEEFLMHRKGLAPKIAAVPVLVLDGNDAIEDKEYASKLIQKVHTFMQNIVSLQPQMQLRENSL